MQPGWLRMTSLMKRRKVSVCCGDGVCAWRCGDGVCVHGGVVMVCVCAWRCGDGVCAWSYGDGVCVHGGVVIVCVCMEVW